MDWFINIIVPLREITTDFNGKIDKGRKKSGNFRGSISESH